MRNISENRPMEGLEKISKNVKYLASKRFVMAELNVDNGTEYISVYLRPFDENKTIITAYLPEMQILRDLNLYDKTGLLKFLCSSKKISKLYKNGSKISNKPFISITNDFTEPYKNRDVLCIHKIISLPLTPNVINEETDQFRIFEKGVDEIGAIAVEFLKIHSEYTKDINTHKRLFDSRLLKPTIELCEKKGFWGDFINKLDNIPNSEVRNYIKKNKIAIVCNKYTYSVGSKIEMSDRMHDAHVVILAEAFDNSLKGSDYILWVELKHDYSGWHTRVNLGKLIGIISSLMNNVNTKDWAKIPKHIYKNMPKTTELWFYSNFAHEDMSLHHFVEYGEQKGLGWKEPIILVDEPDHIEFRTSFGSISTDDPWNIYGRFNTVYSIAETALSVLYEYQNYSSSLITKKAAKYIIEGTKLVINPYKYGLKKLLGLDKKED